MTYPGGITNELTQLTRWPIQAFLQTFEPNRPDHMIYPWFKMIYIYIYIYHYILVQDAKTPTLVGLNHIIHRYPTINYDIPIILFQSHVWKANIPPGAPSSYRASRKVQLISGRAWLPSGASHWELPLMEFPPWLLEVGATNSSGYEDLPWKTGD